MPLTISYHFSQHLRISTLDVITAIASEILLLSQRLKCLGRLPKLLSTPKRFLQDRHELLVEDVVRALTQTRPLVQQLQSTKA